MMSKAARAIIVADLRKVAKEMREDMKKFPPGSFEASLLRADIDDAENTARALESHG